MRLKFFKASLLGLICLTSCYVGMPKSQQEENLIAEPSLDLSVATSLENPLFTLGDWPNENWWSVFNSPQLDCLIQEAISNNPALMSIEANVEEKREESIIARSRLFPYLSFDGTYSKDYLSHNGLYRALNPKLPLSVMLVDLDFNLDYDFDFWGKNYNLFLAAYGETLAQKAEAAQLRLIITTAVAQAYFSLKANLLRHQIYQTLFEVSQNNFQLQSFLQKKALSSELTPLLLQESYNEAKKLLVGNEQEIELNKHLLNRLLGKGPDEPLCIDAQLEPLPDKIVIPENLSLDLLARRPDLMAQIWRAQAWAYRVGAAIADFYPDVRLSAFVGLESVSWGKLLQSHSKTTEVKPAIHLPLFTAGAIRANVEAQTASFDAAVFDYNDLVLASVQEVADLLVIARTLFEQKKEQEQIVKATAGRYKITQIRQKAGLDSAFADYSLQTELANKQLEDLNLLYAEYVAVIKLIKALGGGYVSDYEIPLQACGES